MPDPCFADRIRIKSMTMNADPNNFVGVNPWSPRRCILHHGAIARVDVRQRR